MAVVPWPVTLQDKFNSDSFTFQYGDTTIRSKNDVGPDKVRRISTRPINKVQGSIHLNYGEFSVFDTFYNTTLNGGVNQFTLENPFTGTLAAYRFLSPPSIRPLGGGVSFIVSMELEILP